MNSKEEIRVTKTRFARRFLTSLCKIRTSNNHRLGVGPSEDDDDGEILKRTRRIKIAAYSSMARAVGSRRAWSKAFLSKLRNRRRRFCRISRSTKSLRLKQKKKRVVKSNYNKVKEEMNKTDMLRKVIPGGTAMDFGGLLEETAHYMTCLATQVKVMQSIVDHYSK